MAYEYTIQARQIPWHPYSSRRVLPLGRHVRHDSRNLQYPFPRVRSVSDADVLRTRHIPILDQGDLGSCTGNAAVGALGTSNVFEALPSSHPTLTEPLAVSIYSQGTKLDSTPGTYPPEDTGSDGGSVCKACQQDGYISSYTWAFGLDHVLAALDTSDVLFGIEWFDSFDQPDSSGLIKISPNASVRGGHEILCRGKSQSRQLVFCDNSWGAGWGLHGSFSIGYGDLETLLANQGDAVVPTPLNIPAPDPTPVPPNPPDPADPDAAYWSDPRLAAWSKHHHVQENLYAAQQYAAGRERHQA